MAAATIRNLRWNRRLAGNVVFSGSDGIGVIIFASNHGRSYFTLSLAELLELRKCRSERGVTKGLFFARGSKLNTRTVAGINRHYVTRLRD
jgi:hypothetical protein